MIGRRPKHLLEDRALVAAACPAWRRGAVPLSLIALLAAGAIAPADASTTVEIKGIVWAYNTRDFSTNFNRVSGGNDDFLVHRGYVGTYYSDGEFSTINNGNNAATIDFDVSGIPLGAIVTNASLIIPDAIYYSQPSTIQVRNYIAPSSIADPSRANAGSVIATYVGGASSYTALDVTSTIAADLAGLPVGWSNVGFSFQQTAGQCRPVGKNGYSCSSFLGANRTQSLKITYDFPPPQPPEDPGTPVPEPSTWAMMLVGFGAIGSAMRRRERRAVSLA
jgi:hypothetical protein